MTTTAEPDLRRLTPEGVREFQRWWVTEMEVREERTAIGERKLEEARRQIEQERAELANQRSEIEEKMRLLGEWMQRSGMKQS